MVQSGKKVSKPKRANAATANPSPPDMSRGLSSKLYDSWLSVSAPRTLFVGDGVAPAPVSLLFFMASKRVGGGGKKEVPQSIYRR